MRLKKTKRDKSRLPETTWEEIRQYIQAYGQKEEADAPAGTAAALLASIPVAAAVSALQAAAGIQSHKKSVENREMRQDCDRSKALDDLLRSQDEGFSAMLLRLIDEKGRQDVEVYKAANVDRRTFSKIRSNQWYQPKKTTALAFAVSLHLSVEETENLLNRAGFSLSNSSKQDIIVRFFLEKGLYDIHKINIVLQAYDQSLLGAA